MSSLVDGSPLTEAVGLKSGVDTSLTVAMLLATPSSPGAPSRASLAEGEMAGVRGVTVPAELGFVSVAGVAVVRALMAELGAVMAEVGVVPELVEVKPFCQHICRKSASTDPPYWVATDSQNMSLCASTIRMSLSLSIVSGLQFTRSCFALLLPRFFLGEVDVCPVGSWGFGSNGLPFIFGCVVAPTFWMAPEALTGEKEAIVGLEERVFASGVELLGEATGLVTEAFDEVDDIELLRLRRLPPCDS